MKLKSFVYFGRKNEIRSFLSDIGNKSIQVESSYNILLLVVVPGHFLRAQYWDNCPSSPSLCPSSPFGLGQKGHRFLM